MDPPFTYRALSPANEAGVALPTYEPRNPGGDEVGAHNPEVAGSNPAPATQELAGSMLKEEPWRSGALVFSGPCQRMSNGPRSEYEAAELCICEEVRTATPGV